MPTQAEPALKKLSKRGKKFKHTEPMQAESALKKLPTQAEPALKNCLRRLSLRKKSKNFNIFKKPKKISNILLVACK
jgi:hypothetical protein